MMTTVVIDAGDDDDDDDDDDAGSWMKSQAFPGHLHRPFPPIPHTPLLSFQATVCASSSLFLASYRCGKSENWQCGVLQASRKRDNSHPGIIRGCR